MKKIVLVALLAVAAGCGSKKTGSDCESAITKGIENAIKVLKERAPNPQMVEAGLGIMDKVKGVLIERCKADSWPPEGLSCFAATSDVMGMRACRSKLTPEQASKLTAELSQVMRGIPGMQMGQRMPPGMPGHPDTLMPNRGSDATPGAVPAPGATTGSSDTPAAAGAAAPSATPPAPPGAAAPAGSAAPAGGSAPK